MICGECKEAADLVAEARLKPNDDISDRLEKIVKDLHSFCTELTCDCQHKIDWEGTKYVRQ